MVKDSLLGGPSADTWKRVGTGKRAGFLVPLFSVYSQQSVGIGDLHDLTLLIDLCQKTGCSILQLLPMNEIGATFCP
ncbi:4-alpha-glucanotransferase, partial [bacterium]